MKNALLGLWRIKSLQNNYLSLVIVAVLFSTTVFSQTVDTTKILQNIEANGYNWKGGKFRSYLVIPSDTPKLKLADSGAISYKGGGQWLWNGRIWKKSSGNVTLSQGGDSTYFLIGADTVLFISGGAASSTIYSADDSLTATRKVTIPNTDTLIFLNKNSPGTPFFKLRSFASPLQFFTNFYNGIIEMNYGGATGSLTTYAPGGITYSPVNYNAAYNMVSTKNLKVSLKGLDVVTFDTIAGIKFNQYGLGTFTGTATKSLNVDATGNIIEGAAASSGTYTPTAGTFVNVTSNGTVTGMWTKIGSIYHVQISSTLTPTATGATSVNLTLPFATTQANGTFIGQAVMVENTGTAYAKGAVNIVSSTTVIFRYISTVAASGNYVISFDYY